MSTQQMALFEIPRHLTCLYCHADRRKVQIDREILVARYHKLSDTQGVAEVICCTPGSDCKCPNCDAGIDELSFAMHYAESTDDESAEMYECHRCGSHGEASECEPPIDPWTELDQVAHAMESAAEIMPRIWPPSMAGGTGIAEGVLPEVA